MQIVSAVLFWMFAGTTLVYGWRHNARYDRALVAMIGLAVVVTALLGWFVEAADAYVGVMTVDASLALFAIGVALVSSAHWPMWFAGFALVGALTAIANSWMGSNYWLFRMLTGFWAIPALFSLLIGSLRDVRAREARGPSPA